MGRWKAGCVGGKWFRVEELSSEGRDVQMLVRPAMADPGQRELKFTVRNLKDGTVELHHRKGPLSRDPSFMLEALCVLRDLHFVTAFGNDGPYINFSLTGSGPVRSFKDILK